MANVIIRRYNTFFDQRTNVQFNPILDTTTGLYIGLAKVPDSDIGYFSSNSAYEVVSDNQLSAMTNGAEGAPSLDAKLLSDAATLTQDLMSANTVTGKTK